MLSVLIPVYNVCLVKELRVLYQQLIRSSKPFEIICIDDMSEGKYRRKNRTISGIPFVNYVESSEKLGRSKIRNRLGKLARYDNLLFLDADFKINSDQFVDTYLQYLDCSGPTYIVCGGTLYSEKKPSAEKRLHWKYGQIREALPAGIRNTQTLRHFHTNNFMVDRQTLLENPFDEEIRGYGYEDYAWASALEKLNLKVTHIQNPLLHRGLKKRKQFLSDMENSIHNLVLLHMKGKIPPSPLLSFYLFLNKWQLLSAAGFFLKYSKNGLSSLLSRPNPPLWALDLLKIYHLTEGFRKHI